MVLAATADELRRYGACVDNRAMPLRTVLDRAIGVATLALAVVGSVACSSEPTVNYGSPGNLNEAKLPGEGGAEPLSCEGGIEAGEGGGGGTGDGGCAVSWTNDLYPKMTSGDPHTWGCATANCHAKAGNGPVIDPTDPAKALAALQAYHLLSQPSLAYVDKSGDPSKSTIECNVSGGCTPAMPQAPFAPLSEGDRCQLDAWLRCGAPGN